MFKNMGLFWRRSDVFWGRPKNQGALLGVHKKAKRSDPVNFWEQSGVYALYGNYKLIYVGQTKRLGKRIKEHTSDDFAGRWDTFSWFGIGLVKNNGELKSAPKNQNLKLQTILDIVEAITTTIAEPPLNSQDGRFGDSVERYLQVRDTRIDSD